MEKKTFYIIDGHSHIYRAFHALPEDMTSPSGEPTNAIFGFMSMFRKLLKDRSPDYLTVTFDKGKAEERLELFEDYKAHREPMPDNLRSQIPKVIEILTAMNVPICIKEGHEADDVIATLVKKAKKKGLTTYILTGDKDLFQVIDDNTFAYDTKKEKIVDAHAVRDKFGVDPELLGDWLALVGDTSDNIPGVKGIGPKGATELLTTFGSLGEILANPDRIEKKGTRKKIEDDADSARLSRQLVELRSDLKLDVGPTDCDIKEPDALALRQLYMDLGFMKFAQEIAIPRDETPKNYTTITKKTQLDKLVKKLKKAKEISVDTETTSQYTNQAELVGISVSVKEKEAAYIPVGGLGDHLAVSDVVEKLKSVLEDEKIAKTGQNLKYDIIVLERHGISLKGVEFDTMVASYVLNPTRRGHGMDNLALEHLQYSKIPFKEVLAKRKSLAEVPIEEVSPYACEDADIALRLTNVLRPAIEEAGLMDLYRDCEMPLIEVLAGMEETGIRIDAKYLEDVGRDLETKITVLQTEIWKMAEEEFNISSPSQLSTILFEKMGLKPGKRTKTGYSTDVKVLERLSSDHEMPRMVLQFRQLSKLKSTYVDALIDAAGEAQRIHASFNQTVTATGRLSSSNPNLQNIPIRREEGKKIRKAFIPSRKGMVLLSCDYSQIELRFLAHFSGDEAMINAFERGEDIHTRVAAEVFNEENVTEDMRRRAKAVNFGLIYGQSQYGLASQLSIPLEEAAAFIESYFGRYPKIRAFMDGTIQHAREEGSVKTILGRHRPIPMIDSGNQAARQAAERMAVNTVIQGSAADLMKLAMIAVWKRLPEHEGLKMLVQVHDELLFEVPTEGADTASEMVVEEMTAHMQIDVPLEVDVKTGRNWAEI